MKRVGWVEWEWDVCDKCAHYGIESDTCALGTKGLCVGQDPDSLETVILCGDYKAVNDESDD